MCEDLTCCVHGRANRCGTPIMVGHELSRGFWITLGSAMAVVLLLFAAWYPYRGGGRQRYNMRIAEEQLPEVQAVLDADPRLKLVEIGVYSGQDGAVGLFGWVESADDLFRLMRAVAAKHLAIAVHWQLYVAGEADKSPSRQP